LVDLTDMAKRKTIEELFKGRHFEQEIIILCMRWYLRFKLSSRALVEIMAERGLAISHTTILRWVQRFVPEFEKRWNRYATAAGSAWRVDDTYVKVRGQWMYLYRAGGSGGQGGRFPVERTTQRGCGQELSAPDAQVARHGTVQYYARRLHCIALYRGRVVEPGWRAERNNVAIIEVFEQHDRAGLKEREAADWTHARVQALRVRVDYNCGHRTDASSS
jgi:hypothetical protein